MTLQPQDIKKLAILARINVTPEEEVRFATTISTVLDYMNVLKEVDTTSVAATAQVTGLADVVRADVAVPSPLAAALLDQMPLREEGELVVPGVFENSTQE
jgi:aspartyl-tRNA(Asn)/glutamyl-tRNA(Gln) amidotransferase subunit C